MHASKTSVILPSIQSQSVAPSRRRYPVIFCAGLGLFLLLLARPARVQAQGCVAAGFCPLSPLSPVAAGDLTNTVIAPNGWQGSVAYRWFKSDRHFVGDVEQPQRPAAGTEVINDVHSFDVSATYGINPRWS